MSLQIAKKALRSKIKDKLKCMTNEERKRQSEIVALKLFKNEKYIKSQRISIYLSRDIEISTEAILTNIFDSGKECFIPKYDSKSMDMEMLKLYSFDDYKKLPLTSWNIKQPDENDNQRINALSSGGLDLIILPGIGFTTNGLRIGNGRGYYDAYIKKCQMLLKNKFSTIALAFKEQIVPSIPVDEHDVIIDEVIFPDE